jgi:hypothetical protein
MERPDRLQREENMRGTIPQLYSILICLFLIVTASSCGCIKVVERSVTSQTAAGDATPIATIDRTAPDMTGEGGRPPVVTATPLPTAPPVVVAADPILIDDPYKTLHATRIPETDDNRSVIRTPVYEKSYILRGEAYGLVVNATKGPLIVTYDVTPVYDCLEKPDTCRGTIQTPVNRPYCTITVRDNESHAILAQDGYAREYSSQKSGRRIMIFRDGQFHITVEGNYLTVRISIVTGDSPIKQDTGEEEDY